MLLYGVEVAGAFKRVKIARLAVLFSRAGKRLPPQPWPNLRRVGVQHLYLLHFKRHPDILRDNAALRTRAEIHIKGLADIVSGEIFDRRRHTYAIVPAPPRLLRYKPPFPLVTSEG